jgi:F0F1-type ATP synthase assembly protein I
MKQWNAFGLAMQLSWTLLFSLLIPLLIGIWLDRHFGIEPWGVLAGTGLGVLAATVGVARVAIRMFPRPTVKDPGRTETDVEGEEESHE